MTTSEAIKCLISNNISIKYIVDGYFNAAIEGALPEDFFEMGLVDDLGR